MTALALAGIVAGGAGIMATEFSSPRDLFAGRPHDAQPDTDVPPPESAGTDGLLPAGSAPATTDRDFPGGGTPANTPVPTPPPPETEPDEGIAPAHAWRATGPAAFRHTPRNTVRTAPPRLDDGAVRFSVTGPGQRTELEPDIPVLREGDEYYFAFSVRLDDDFPVGGASRQVITQWKNDSPGNAPLDLRVWNGRLAMHGGDGHPSGPKTFTRVLGPAKVDLWTEIVIRIRFSANPNNGSVSAWQDGEEVVADYRPPGGTLYPCQSSYLKTGLSRDPRITRPAEVAFRDWRVGATPGSVR